jgi:L-histidine Nalpha-methyltransferase
MSASVRVPERRVITPGRKAFGAGDFAEEVRIGLGTTPKSLPTRYLYDELGSALFEAICKVPEYYSTRAESALLEQHAAAMVAAMGNGRLELVELGVGSGEKSRFLIDALFELQDHLDYHAIDISAQALDAAVRAMCAEYPALQVHAYARDYFDLLLSRELTTQGRTLVLFLGSSIGNYDPSRAATLLRELARSLRSGDGLLMGVDSEDSVEAFRGAYNDPIGVNSAFAKNLLSRINRELGGGFDLNQFELDVDYDPVRKAVDSFLVARAPQCVRISDLDMMVSLIEGERIQTESAYKFSRARVDRLAREAGFSLAQSWKDQTTGFAEHLLVVC